MHSGAATVVKSIADVAFQVEIEADSDDDFAYEEVPVGDGRVDEREETLAVALDAVKVKRKISGQVQAAVCPMNLEQPEVSYLSSVRLCSNYLHGISDGGRLPPQLPDQDEDGSHVGGL